MGKPTRCIERVPIVSNEATRANCSKSRGADEAEAAREAVTAGRESYVVKEVASKSRREPWGIQCGERGRVRESTRAMASGKIVRDGNRTLVSIVPREAMRASCITQGQLQQEPRRRRGGGCVRGCHRWAGILRGERGRVQEPARAMGNPMW